MAKCVRALPGSTFQSLKTPIQIRPGQVGTYFMVDLWNESDLSTLIRLGLVVYVYVYVCMPDLVRRGKKKISLATTALY